MWSLGVIAHTYTHWAHRYGIIQQQLYRYCAASCAHCSGRHRRVHSAPLRPPPLVAQGGIPHIPVLRLPPCTPWTSTFLYAYDIRPRLMKNLRHGFWMCVYVRVGWWCSPQPGQHAKPWWRQSRACEVPCAVALAHLLHLLNGDVHAVGAKYPLLLVPRPEQVVQLGHQGPQLGRNTELPREIPRSPAKRPSCTAM